MDLSGFFEGATPLDVKQRMVDVLRRYAASATFTAVVSRGLETAPRVWPWALIAVLAVVGILVWWRRHSAYGSSQR